MFDPDNLQTGSHDFTRIIRNNNLVYSDKITRRDLHYGHTSAVTMCMMVYSNNMVTSCVAKVTLGGGGGLLL